VFDSNGFDIAYDWAPSAAPADRRRRFEVNSICQGVFDGLTEQKKKISTNFTKYEAGQNPNIYLVYVRISSLPVRLPAN
jgi:hypothetical protein